MRHRPSRSRRETAFTIDSVESDGLVVADLSKEDADALTQFHDESLASRATGVARSKSFPNWFVWMLALSAVAQLGVVIPWAMKTWSTSASTSTAIVESSPEGAQVPVDSRQSGVTPARLSVAPGQRVDFIAASTAPAAPARGVISVTTDGASASVSVDRVPRGLSPVVVSDLVPGDHAVTVTSATGTVERTITVQSGATASLAVTMPSRAKEATSPASASGWIHVEAKEPLRIVEDGKLIGTSEVDRLMLAAGNHTLDLVNRDLGFSARRVVSVKNGATSELAVELPRVPFAINAQPWADVWLDGQPVGATPIGAVSTSIGRHELVFRHPQYGERRASVVLTLDHPARIGLDLRTSNGEGSQ